MSDEWHQTACILCSINCGVEVKLDGPTIERVRGDKAHPASEGYTCEKALRLDHYQNGAHRLTSPMRRRPDGTFEAVDWDTAIAEVAARFQDVIDAHGGEKILFYGGGGQGNHLGGGYGSATRSALGITLHLQRTRSGEDRRVLGRRPTLRQVQLPHHRRLPPRRGVGLLGQEPMAVPRLPAGPPRAQGDRQRPRPHDDRRRPAAHRDRPISPTSTSGRCPAATRTCSRRCSKILASEYAATSWLFDNANGLDELRGHLDAVDIGESCAKAGVPGGPGSRGGRGDRPGDRRRVDLRRPRHPDGAALDAQQLPGEARRAAHRQFRRKGGMNLHTRFASLGSGGGASGRPRHAGDRPPSGHGLVPCNVIPEEIIGDHPDRFRSMLVESGNPAHSLADSQAMRDGIASARLRRASSMSR